MKPSDDDQVKLMRPGVSRELADERSRQISQLRYELDLKLATSLERLTGQIKINFVLMDATAPVILDYRDLEESGKVRDQLLINPVLINPVLINPEVTDLSANGHPVVDAIRHNGHILIPANHFQRGGNEITLGFSSPIARVGRPLIRYTDPEDGSDYIYHLPVPMDASLAFPCFDQPDLKGCFSLTIETPKDWLAISNGERIEADIVPGRHRFAETPPLSTYLFSFAVGPFAIITETESLSISEKGRDLPLRLYCRRTREARARQEWSTIRSITRQGIDHLSDYLDFQFPFSKYDQVLLPGFPFQGMEHAGATFLREESVLFPTTPTRGDLLNRTSLILHELVHQWFGDLVTMRWFDDLWIKEGFANYLAYRTMEATEAISDCGLEPRQIWKRFHLMHKPAAYAIDASQGATPIHQEVRNLKDAKSAYGAIVYQKAPAILRSLCFKLGEEPFRDGVRHFLKRYAFGNADWRDLINSFEEISGETLSDWAAAWIRERGMPRIRVDWRHNGNQIEHIRITQQDISENKRYWPVKARLRVVQRDGKASIVDYLLTEGETEITTLRGMDIPHYIIANDEDLAYGRFVLDQHSLHSVIDEIGDGRIDDPFLKTILWRSLWDSLLEGELDPVDYLNLARRSIPCETDEDLLQNLLEIVATLFERNLPKAEQTELAPKIEELLSKGMLEAPTPEARMLHFRLFLRLASTKAAREQLKSLLAEEVRLPEIEILQHDRWKMVTALLALDDPEAERLFVAEKLRDRSGDAERQAWMAEAARPDLATKERYFARYLSPEGIPEDWIVGSLAGFNSRHQAELTLPFVYPALAALPQLKAERKIFFINAWLEAFIGGQPSINTRLIIRAFLVGTPLSPDLVTKLSFYLPGSRLPGFLKSGGKPAEGDQPVLSPGG